MNPITRYIGLSVVAATLHAFAGEPLPPEGGKVRQTKTGEYVFTLLPKAFQQTPELEMTFNSKVTPFGRSLGTPSPEKPVYFVGVDSGYSARGDNAGEPPPPSAKLQQAMMRALAVNGYLPATPEHPPTIAIIYHWGSHMKMPLIQELDPRGPLFGGTQSPELESDQMSEDRTKSQEEPMFSELHRRHQLERAMLVGGREQARVMGRSSAAHADMSTEALEYESLNDQANDDLYFVVASAYDYEALARKERKLIWRTTMTANARGVSMQESMGPLIATAGPYFGRDMDKPILAERRIQAGDVKIGPTTVVEEETR